MKKIGKISSGILSLALIAGLFSGAAVLSEDDVISVELDNTAIEFDVDPQIINGRTMVPLRKIFEEIGALVKWDSDTQTVSARKNSKTVTLSINSADMQIDKGDTDDEGNPIIETVTLEVPAQISDGRTLVPARAISEAFGLDVDWDENNKKVIITSGGAEDESWKENTGTINLTDLTYTGNGVEITDKQISITSGGDFTLTGTLSGGSITVSAEEKVKLRLDGAEITSPNGPCIFVEKADKAYITLTEGTENLLTAKNSNDGAIYSKDNLEIGGSGRLTVSSPAGHAIKASDNLTIENGTMVLTAFGDGMHINDTFKMKGGEVNITATGDGIDSESIVIISGGKLNIETNGEPIIAEQSPQNDMRGFMGEQTSEVSFEKSSKGINAEWMMCISGGEITVNSASHAVHCADEIEITGGVFTLTSEYEKGISAHGNLTVSNSDTVIDIVKSTEGMESKKTAVINDGTIKIVASDDGINATGGKSGEDMGGGRPVGTRERQGFPAGSELSLTDEAAAADAPPVGVIGRGNRPNRQENAFQGAAPTERPESGMMNRPEFSDETGNMKPDAPAMQGGMGGSMSDCLIINGGNIEIIAQDDCLDSNGNMVLNGGIIKAIKVNGSFTGPNSVFDADGKITVSQGVTLIAAGSGGTQGNLSIPQNTITFYSEAVHSAGESITVTDENGDIIAEYTPRGNYSAFLITSPELEEGKTYTVTLGDETQKVTLQSQTTSVGTQQGGSPGKNRNIR